MKATRKGELRALLHPVTETSRSFLLTPPKWESWPKRVRDLHSKSSAVPSFPIKRTMKSYFLKKRITQNASPILRSEKKPSIQLMIQFQRLLSLISLSSQTNFKLSRAKKIKMFLKFKKKETTRLAVFKIKSKLHSSWNTMKVVFNLDMCKKTKIAPMTEFLLEVETLFLIELSGIFQDQAHSTLEALVVHLQLSKR